MKRTAAPGVARGQASGLTWGMGGWASRGEGRSSGIIRSWLRRPRELTRPVQSAATLTKRPYTISDLLNTFSAAGLWIETTVQPQMPAEAAERYPHKEAG